MKRLFSTITALAMAASLCMSALPVYAVDETAETPVCTCTELCTEGTVNDACPVCAEDLTQCAGKAAETPADSEGEPEAETPVCTCTELCAEGAVNDACPVCAEDLTQCAGKAAETPADSEGEPEAETPACTCTEQCTEGAVNDACPVCAEDLTQCAGKAAEPEEKPEEPETPQAPETSEEQAPSNGSNTPVTLSADGEHGTHEGYTPLNQAALDEMLGEDGYILPEGSYYLDGNVSLGQYEVANKTAHILKIQGDVTLCLNGNVLDLKENHIEVLGVDSSLTIKDCRPNEEHKFRDLLTTGSIFTDKYVGTGKEQSLGWILDENNGTCIVKGGVITNGDRSDETAPAGDPENVGKGGAIYVVDGSLTLESGNIAGNRAGFSPKESSVTPVNGYGGAIYVKDGSFTMKGGRIAGNAAPGWMFSAGSGGGVCLDGSNFTLEQGTIDYNFAYGDKGIGGGVALINSSHAELKNGDICNNDSSLGGGINLTESDANLYDGCYIKQNYGANVGGGVALYQSTLMMYGGAIDENENGNYSGGGISVYDHSVFEMHGGSISENIGSMSGGVYVSFSQFTMFEGLIDKNQSQRNAGGVSVYSGQFVMKGGTISNNHAEYRTGTYAGGVSIERQGTFVMEQGTITNNSSTNTGGLYNMGTTTLKGGTISNNSGTVAGGINTTNILNLQGGQIFGNQSSAKASDASKTFANGILVDNWGKMNLSGTPQIASTDDVALYIADDTAPDAERNSYINVNAAYTGSDASPVTVTPVLKGTTPTWLEEPSAATGTKLVVFADESAAAAADTAKWFAPSAAMLEQEPTLEVGQSHPQKTWLTFVKYADIAPAGMTIYVGGNGYTGVVDDSGTTVGAENGFPVPGFTVTIPGVTSVEAGELGLQYKKDETTMQWDAQLYGTGATKVYRFAPDENTGNTPVRIQFLHQVGDEQVVVDSDDFVVTDYLNETLGMRVYGESIEQDYVTLQYDGRAYYLRTADSQMTVRSTTDHVQYGALTNDGSAVAKDAPGVVAQSGTTYTINDSNVQVADTSGVALLFDNIIENNTNKENKSNTQLLRERADEVLAEVETPNLDEGTYRHYECKYLDLVDTKNGNAWVKASQDVTVYWPLPDGTDASTKFELLHFTDMHRDMGVSQIENKIDTCTVVRENVTVKGNHITFETDGFSPYVLVWQTDTSSSQGDLVVSKTVAGSQGETDRLFNFTVTLSGSTLNGWYGGMEFKNGVATFQLPHNGRIMAEGLPAGITYTVTETEAGQDGYVTTVADNNATGRIAADGVTNVAFVNTKEETTEPVPSPDPGETPDNGSNNGSDSGSNTPAKTPAPAQNVSAAAAPAAQAAAAVIPQTGDDSQPLMWVVLAAGSLGLLAVLLAAKRRRTDK